MRLDMRPPPDSCDDARLSSSNAREGTFHPFRRQHSHGGIRYIHVSGETVFGSLMQRTRAQVSLKILTVNRCFFSVIFLFTKF